MEGGLDANAVWLARAAREAGLDVASEPAGGAGSTQSLKIAIGNSLYTYRNRLLTRGSLSGVAVAPVNDPAVRIASSKGGVRALLSTAGLPVPKGRLFDGAHIAEAMDYAIGLDRPVSVRPDEAAKTSPVLTGRLGRDEIAAALMAVLHERRAALVEETVRGKLCRFFYVEPSVAGIQLRRKGSSFDCTAAVHPTYSRLAEAAAHAVEGFRIGTVDIRILDMHRPASPGNCWVLGINCSPSIETFHHPSEGQPQDIAGAIVAYLRSDAAKRATAGPDSGDSDLDPHAALLREAAERAGLETETVMVASPRSGKTLPHLQFTAAGIRYDFRSGRLHRIPGTNPGAPGRHVNGPAVSVTTSKGDTKAALLAAGLSAPQGRVFDGAGLDEALAYAATLAGPVCVKPNRGTKGRLVFPDRSDATAVAEAFREVAVHFPEILVEQSVSGEEIRFFYVEPEVVAVKMSVRPSIVGNGTQTVLELIGEKNRMDASTRLANQKLIVTDHRLVALLAEQGLDLLSVPEAGRRIAIGRTANGTSGGGHVECRDSVDRSYWRRAEEAFQAIPEMVLGTLDMIVADRRQPAKQGNYWILEINSSPGLLPYHKPWEGRPQDVSAALIDYLQRHGAA